MIYFEKLPQIGKVKDQHIHWSNLLISKLIFHGSIFFLIRLKTFQDKNYVIINMSYAKSKQQFQGYENIVTLLKQYSNKMFY
jgi:hypothetical protein